MRAALTISCALALGLVLAGCRRLPGPEACHDFAVHWFATETHGASTTRLTSEQEVVVEDAVLELTTECLTRPYDQDLVKCVTEGGAPRPCLADFERRHGEIASGAARQPSLK
jgi:hypothetical protein